ncbi:VWA domain-containing protein [Luteolibacter pohnpeiensis]|uniref:VWA domain-containing protein n=2 Tax=Luteolibacter pohnpeiensis TaxID=454153 RepID=A0A934S5R4_9BACT|nr:VWA domain-containing protein [Luteolibacter pohnpeiensis]
MAQAASDGKSRAQVARNVLAQAVKQANEADVPIRIHPFAEALEAPLEPDQLPSSDKDGSQILMSLSQVLQNAASTGESLAGIMVLSDGRDTSGSGPDALADIALRANSQNTNIHTVAIGADQPAADLALQLNRSAITAFPGQHLRIPFALKSTGLEPLKAQVSLLDENGSPLQQLSLEVESGGTSVGTFDLTAPSVSCRWTLETPVVAGESRKSNNRAGANIRIVESKTRVFLAEGAPYWDSKFLAQLLRQQPQMEVHSVHRLSDERYFRIDTGSDETTESEHPVFPATLDELGRYDLIVFGKNVDPFLTPERAEALRQYVRDRGGAVLLSRGKPTTGDVPALDDLEPVIWGSARISEFQFEPSAEGENTGLFGQALPPPDASLWKSLPTLKDGRQVSLIKPFTRVLANGQSNTSASASGKFPALMVRRHGQGVVGLLNGDGLWRWDFFPEARELGNCYDDFWIQLIQWMATYSEFLPGQDFSLRLPASHGTAGSAVAATISYRGTTPLPDIQLKVIAPNGEESLVHPALLTDAYGRPMWRGSFTPTSPGDWHLSILDPRDHAPSVPETVFTVPHPPSEQDDLSADPDFLNHIATATGGTALTAETAEAFIRQNLLPKKLATRETGAVWKPSWNLATVAILIAALLSAEWFFRRRLGLA